MDRNRKEINLANNIINQFANYHNYLKTEYIS